MNTQNEKFWAISIRSSELLNDHLHIAFEEFGADGVESIQMDEAEVDALLGERAYSGGDLDDALLDQVSALDQEWQKIYFYDGNDSYDRAKACLEKLKSLGAIARLEEFESVDWSESWKEYYKPIPISKNLRVMPAWMKSLREPRDIFINPARGFGTGGHETTFLCLKIFDELLTEPKKLCLDFGCGSGILGISAIKKGEMFVDFVDIDHHALDNTLENLKLNFADDQLNGHALVIRERFFLKEKYDLCFANILAHVLKLESQLLFDSLVEGGYLILSGILLTQASEIRTHFELMGLSFVKQENKGDWSCLLMKK